MAHSHHMNKEVQSNANRSSIEVRRELRKCWWSSLGCDGLGLVTGAEGGHNGARGGGGCHRGVASAGGCRRGGEGVGWDCRWWRWCLGGG